MFLVRVATPTQSKLAQKARTVRNASHEQSVATLTRPGPITRLVTFSVDHARAAVLIGLLLGLIAGAFAATRFALTSNTDDLIAQSLPWRQREAAFNRLFNPQGDQIVTVVDGATPELAEQAAAALFAALNARPDLFHDVRRPDATPFFQQNGLLYETTPQVQSQMAKLVSAQPFLGPLAADPSLRGLAGALSTTLDGVIGGQAQLTDLDPPIVALADTLEGQRAGKPVYFSWRALISGKTAPKREKRRIVVASPVLNYAKLQSGAGPTAFIRDAARAARFDPAHGVVVRLTGPVPLQDEEFATLADRAALIGALALIAIVSMLWMAVRSVRLIGAILGVTVVGLTCASAVGLLVFHTFNVISVAFIPLFVGLGIDFGIQFSVRYRTEHTPVVTIREALIASGRGMGRSLTLAAAAIACGFLAFAPTAYVGLSQLGVIAGLGMFIALGLNLTLLPALIRVLNPPPVPARTAQNPLQRLDGYILSHRRLVIGAALTAAAVCAATLPFLRFDFNPIHLKSAKAESVATLLDLMADPDQSPNTLENVTSDLGAAAALARRMEKLPQVREARTLQSFVPDDQPAKLAAIGDAATLLDFTLAPLVIAPPPTDAETVAALRKTAADLRAAAKTLPAEAPHALRLAADLDALAAAAPDVRVRASEIVMPGLQTVLDQTRTALTAAPVTLQSLPADLVRDWRAPDGRARVSLVAKGDTNDNAVLDRFIAAVLPLAPNTTGQPYDLQQGGRTVALAFAQGGFYSFIAITLLLFAVLRRARDVAITMAPIVLTGLLTLGSCVAIGQSLNFANIIALPLLFGIGVAFHIYFVMAWRAGGALLQSSLTTGIFFSALATATGFGSLWASSHPGTASMGKLLMISLVWTLVSALLFQPALMGPSPADKTGHA